MGEEAKDGVTVDETGGVRSGVAHAPSLGCSVCYMRKRRTKEHEAALNSTCSDVMELPRLPPLERVQARVKDVITSRGMVDWREVGE